MALQRFVVTATTTISAGTAATPTPGEPGTGGAAGYGSSATPQTAATFAAGNPADPRHRLGAVCGAERRGALRPFTDGDTVGHAGLAG